MAYHNFLAAMKERKNQPIIEIRPIRDLGPWAKELQRIYLDAYQEDYLYAYRDPKRVKRYLKWLLKHADGGFFVAFDQEKPVGFIVVQPDCRYQGEKIPEIHELVVDPAYQGLGIGKRLMQEALNFLTKRGYQKVALWVGEKNEDARRFYERLGFKVTDRQGSWLRMERRLQDSSASMSSRVSRTEKASTTSESSIISSEV